MKIRNILTILLLVFFAFGTYSIIKERNYNLKKTDDVLSFGKDVGAWTHSLMNSTQKVIGAAISEKWLPNVTNETNTSKKKKK